MNPSKKFGSKNHIKEACAIPNQKFVFAHYDTSKMKLKTALVTIFY